jgi:hypothetical protein
MKIRCLRSAIAKKLGWVFAGSALISPTVEAAPLDVNLTVNPSFEDSSPAGWGGFSSYDYSLGYTGPAPAGAGLRYFTGTEGLVTQSHSQTIDLMGNAAAIDAGQINYNLSAFFSTYHGQNDHTAITADFRNATNTLIGSSSTIGGFSFVQGLASLPVLRVWGQNSTNGLVPSGTRSVLLRLDTTRLAGTAADGYTDLVDFRISAIPEPGTLALFAIGGAGVAATWLLRRRQA